MNAFYKSALLLASILVLIASYLAFSMLTGVGDLSIIEPSQADRLGAVAFQLNQRAPRDIDEDTRLEQVVVVPGGVQYIFTLRQLASSEVDIAQFRAAVYERSRIATCSNSKLLNLLVTENVFVEAVYQGNDGKMVTSFRIDGNSCNNAV